MMSSAWDTRSIWTGFCVPAPNPPPCRLHPCKHVSSLTPAPMPLVVFTTIRVALTSAMVNLSNNRKAGSETCMERRGPSSRLASSVALLSLRLLITIERNGDQPDTGMCLQRQRWDGRMSRPAFPTLASSERHTTSCASTLIALPVSGCNQYAYSIILCSACSPRRPNDRTRHLEGPP